MAGDCREPKGGAQDGKAGNCSGAGGHARHNLGYIAQEVGASQRAASASVNSCADLRVTHTLAAGGNLPQLR